MYIRGYTTNGHLHRLDMGPNVQFQGYGAKVARSKSCLGQVEIRLQLLAESLDVNLALVQLHSQGGHPMNRGICGLL